MFNSHIFYFWVLINSLYIRPKSIIEAPKALTSLSTHKFHIQQNDQLIRHITRYNLSLVKRKKIKTLNQENRQVCLCVGFILCHVYTFSFSGIYLQMYIKFSSNNFNTSCRFFGFINVCAVLYRFQALLLNSNPRMLNSLSNSDYVCFNSA